MRKPETTFITSVHKYLPAPSVLYREKMHNVYRGGTFDSWYSGDLADIWVEYKFVRKIPVRVPLIPDLSGLQIDWMKGRHAEGRRVWVVVGHPLGGVVFSPDDALQGCAPERIMSVTLSRQALAAWIMQQTMKVPSAPQIKRRSSRNSADVQDS